MAQVPGARKRRRSTPHSTKFSCLLICVILVRSIWQSVVITHGSSFVADADSALPRLLAISTARRSSEARIKRPHGSQGSYEWASRKSIYSDKVPGRPPHMNNLEISSNDVSYWKQLCHGGNATKLSSKSRILISGIATHTLAVELALALANECHVRKIVGLTAQFAQDVPMNSRIEFLYQRLPRFQYIHHDVLVTQERFNQIVASVRPTHVIHFEPTTFSSPEALAAMPRPIQIRESLENIERFARAIVHYQSHHKPIRFVYVSTPAQPKSVLQSGTLELALPTLLQTFRKHFHLDAMHVKLPNIYGPFRDSALSSETLMPEYNGTLKFPSKTPLMHISDGLELLITAVTAGINPTTKLPRIQAPKSSIYKAKEIIHKFQNSTNVGLDKVINDRTKALISWYHHDNFPFEDVNNVHSDASKILFRKALSTTNRRLAAGQTTGISMLQQRRHTLFPCVSECAIHTSCQAESVWNSILPLSQTVTQDCQFVLYTTAFSRDIFELPVIWTRENVGPWSRNTMCQVAFVSGESKLVETLLEPIDEQKKAAMNGQLQHNRWTLIWLPDDDETSMNEADYVLPKLSPRSLFTRNVTKGMYIEPRANTTYPPLHIIWYILAKKLDTKQIKEPFRRRGKTFSVAPARHIALSTRELGVSPTLIQEQNMTTIASALLKAKRSSSTRDLPTRQLEYYDFVKSRFEFHIPDSLILIHNLELDRARRLRCEWYEEHVFWSSSGQFNRNLEDLSLGYVLGRWLAEQRLESDDEYSEEWGLRIVDSAKGDRLLTDVPLELQPSQYFVKFDF